jgi:putative endonuclease
MLSSKDYGSAGEKQACDFLTRRGCRILATNYRTRYGEIDIIARHGKILCFVEVKSRQVELQGHPFEAVTLAKQRSISRAALLYLQEHEAGDVAVRFDVIAVRGSGTENIEWLPNAFDARET